jgi:N-acetylneuraminic acid mutarotase
VCQSRSDVLGGEECARAVNGGHNGVSLLKSVDILDIATNQWSIGLAMWEKRAGCAAAEVDCGTKLVVVGGENEQGIS